MSFYIIEDDDGNVLDSYGEFNNSVINAMLYDELLEPSVYVKDFGGHVVKLLEAPAKVVVSEEEADMLEKAKHNPTLRPSFMITEYSNSHKGNILGNDLEDRLMSAYVIGWTVEKQKRWNVKVPHTKDVWYYKSLDGNLRTICPEYKKLRGTFTEAEIEHYGLQDCEKEEVTDDEQ